MEILRAEQVSRVFGHGNSRVCALDNITFSVENGSFVSIIGRSGSGKSTLLHTLGGLNPPDSGRIYLQDTDVYSLKEKYLSALRRKRIGFVFQSFNLITEFTVRENICLPSYLDSMPPDEAFISEIMGLLELTDKQNFYPKELSGGEQQKTALARALSVRPAVLLADEPTGHLDVRSGEEVLSLIHECHKKLGQTIILATHDLNAASQSERIITLEDGRIISDYQGDKL